MVEILGYSLDEASECSGFSKSTLRRLINSGKLPAKKCGRRTTILAPELRRLMEALPAIQPKSEQTPKSDARDKPAGGTVS
jgi:excisionase family DNA binding protein